MRRELIVSGSSLSGGRDTTSPSIFERSSVNQLGSVRLGRPSVRSAKKSLLFELSVHDMVCPGLTRNDGMSVLRPLTAKWPCCTIWRACLRESANPKWKITLSSRRSSVREQVVAGDPGRVESVVHVLAELAFHDAVHLASLLLFPQVDAVVRHPTAPVAAPARRRVATFDGASRREAAIALEE